MSMQEEGTNPGAAVGVARLAAGLAQGLALYLLYSAADAKTWPATDGLIFAPLLFVALFVPLGIALGLGNLRMGTLAVWTLSATVVLAALAWYGIWREEPVWQVLGPGKFAIEPEILPGFGLLFFTSAGLFIAHALIAGGDSDRRFRALYPTHFDVAWKLGLQLALAALFVGLFWGLLELGAGLFTLIKIDFFERLIAHRWFAIPATTLAAAAAVHLTDVRAGLVRGARTLVLVLLAWLLPLMTIIAAGFLATLIFTGLEPLWQTRHAAATLLSAAATLVILINAAYQDGEPDRAPPLVLRYAGTLAALLLAPLVAISGYAIDLRVAQYGWSADRVASAACLIVATCYAVGYAAAALRPGGWLKHIEAWNFYTALLVIGVLIAVFSPLADPARIAVASQVARLENGRIAPEKFDFNYLRWDAGRYGEAALRDLASRATGEYGAQIRAKAKTLLAEKIRNEPELAVLKLQIEQNLTVYPKGAKLPASFLNRDWHKVPEVVWLPYCLTVTNSTCDAYLLDLAGDGQNEIVLLQTFNGAPNFYDDDRFGAVFRTNAQGIWQPVGRPSPVWSCKGMIDQIRAGHFSFAPPLPTGLRDIVVNGHRLTFAPFTTGTADCPKEPSSPSGEKR